MLKWCSLLESSVVAAPNSLVTPGPGQDPRDFTPFASGGSKSCKDNKIQLYFYNMIDFFYHVT